MMMDSAEALEVASEVEVCSNRCRWVAEWEEAGEDLVPSSRHRFQVEAPRSLCQRKLKS